MYSQISIIIQLFIIWIPYFCYFVPGQQKDYVLNKVISQLGLYEFT